MVTVNAEVERDLELERERGLWEHGSRFVLDARALGLSDEQFFQFCQDNRDLRIELTAEGEMIVMGPTGSDTGRRNSDLNYQLYSWTERDGTGVCFDSSTGFTLPDGSKLSPDASWARKSRYEALTPEQRGVFAPLCPDFVIELRSRTDRLKVLQKKMAVYVKNGAQLGWLIDPVERKIYVSRPGAEVECLSEPETVAGAPVLPDFVLRLQEIW